MPNQLTTGLLVFLAGVVGNSLPDDYNKNLVKKSLSFTRRTSPVQSIYGFIAHLHIFDSRRTDTNYFAHARSFGFKLRKPE